MTTPTPITDAGLAELADMLAEAKRGRTGLGYNGQHVNGLGFWLIGNAPSLVHRLRTAEAERDTLRSIVEADHRVKAGMMDEINFFRDALAASRAAPAQRGQSSAPAGGGKGRG